MKLENLIKEDGKKEVTINGQKVEVTNYIPVLEKESMANEIIEYIFAIEKDESGRIIDVQPTYNKFLLEVVKTYMVIKNYMTGLELPEEDDYVKIYDMAEKNSLIYNLSKQLPDVNKFLSLLDNKIKQLIKLSNVNRQEELTRNIESLVETIDIMAKDMTIKNGLELDKFAKEVESMPKNQEEFLHAIAEVAKLQGVENTVRAVESIKKE